MCVCLDVSDSVTPSDCSPPGSSVHGIFQARILECIAISFSRGPNRPRDQTCISWISCIDRQDSLPLSHTLTKQESTNTKRKMEERKTTKKREWSCDLNDSKAKSMSTLKMLPESLRQPWGSHFAEWALSLTWPRIYRPTQGQRSPEEEQEEFMSLTIMCRTVKQVVFLFFFASSISYHRESNLHIDHSSWHY